MGTEITLDIGGVNLTYSKNYRGIDHGSLFQEKDRKRCRTEQINYDYFVKNDEELATSEMAFMRPLREIVPRLELLRFTIDAAKYEYKKLMTAVLEENETAEEDSSKKTDYMTFEEFVQFATQWSIEDLNDTDEEIRGRFNDNSNIRRIPLLLDYELDAYSEANYFSRLIGILHPYSVLRILAENKANLDIDVIWHYGCLVNNGWAKEEEFVSGAKRHEKFLIVTEGTSDRHILKHALSILKPQVEDFFTFIDVKKNYPFSGVGSLVNFAKGLIAIDVHNKVVFLFDNDAVGKEAYQTLIHMKCLPDNICCVILPELEQFYNFSTKGAQGFTEENINFRAAAIECYLDLDSVNDIKPSVRWQHYVKNLDEYHGSLEHKEKHAKNFLKQNIDSINNGSYDTKKIEAVLDTLISGCQSILHL